MSGSDQPIYIFILCFKMFIVKGHGYQQDTQTRVENLFHKMLRVDVLYQLLLLTEAPYTVAALKELSLRPRWLSFICIL